MADDKFLKRPCAHCPFRNDRPAYLHRSRAREITNSLRIGESFPCHETVTYNDEGERMLSSKEKYCAGASILMLKEGRSSQMMRISERLGFFKPDELDMTSPVYDSSEEMLDACKGERHTKRVRRL